ncbi:unnamed protein product [Fusarium graminearum]|uniref:Uncharacterized protein n=1 Tax=Gibberella zeae TaxID=5518 RepID=A0A9N8NKV9_GIBZA|nr:unnamed protein product [Fusarium graminearum]
MSVSDCSADSVPEQYKTSLGPEPEGWAACSIRYDGHIIVTVENGVISASPWPRERIAVHPGFPAATRIISTATRIRLVIVYRATICKGMEKLLPVCLGLGNGLLTSNIASLAESAVVRLYSSATQPATNAAAIDKTFTQRITDRTF